MLGGMKISDLIKHLEALKAKHGDLLVKTQTLTHTWDPDIVVKTNRCGTKYVLLNS